MPAETLDPALERLDRLLTRGLPRTVRANAARPQPPIGSTVHPVPNLRLIVCVEGPKEETFGDGQALVRWVMGPGDALVVRPDTWLAPHFHTRHRHLGVIVGVGHARVTWNRCDGRADIRQPLTLEASIQVPMPEHGALRQTADAISVLEGDQGEAARYLVASFLHQLRVAGARPQAPESKGDRTWRLALAYLHDNCNLPIGREQAASSLGLSPNYLSRLCRARGGRSFIEVLTELRLERAAAMLRTVDVPISAVAAGCGFSDAGYFIRRFRRGFGATPGAYRREHGVSS